MFHFIDFETFCKLHQKTSVHERYLQHEEFLFYFIKIYGSLCVFGLGGRDENKFENVRGRGSATGNTAVA